jgi:ankyrin repeat protein
MLLEDPFIVDYMIDSKYNLNVMDSFGATPLQLAACNYPLPMVKRLIKGGADVNLSVYHSPLYLSVERMNSEIILFLLENGATFRNDEERKEAISWLSGIDTKKIIANISQARINWDGRR